MEKLKMHTPDIAEENYRKLVALFPDAVTETTDDDGHVVRAIDKDVLMQEINAKVVDDGQERYQFTWPDKRKSIVLANTPIAKTLRLEVKKSVGRDGKPGGIDSENLYIEGDNLDVLKLLQETYLGKVKMIYIDPPYNTGNDFIYKDDFSQHAGEYAENSGQTDDEGNRLVHNPESNGRFHTDWLNMMYPRLKLAKDLLMENGVIFISIDDNEQGNLKKICDEIFSKTNFVGELIRKTKSMTADAKTGFNMQHEDLLCYAKVKDGILLNGEEKELTNYSNPDDDPKGDWVSGDPSAKSGGVSTYFGIKNPYTKKEDYPPIGRYWAFSKETLNRYISEGKIVFKQGYTKNQRSFIFKRYKKELNTIYNPVNSLAFIENEFMNQVGTRELQNLFGKGLFDNPKPLIFLKKIIQYITLPSDYILDFFSGSATTAHATMQLNAEEGGSRKFIMVQLPEETGEKSEAYKAGYKNICEIGKERIRRAGEKIKEETGADIDYGFRCFKVDSSNMKDVYYRPSDVNQGQMDLLLDNIKEDRTPEDLLIQVMLDLGVLLSSKIEITQIAGKKVFSVENGYLLACFDKDVTEEIVTAIAKKHPFYAVFRDSSMANDSVEANFEQIFETYSPNTVRKVL